MFVKKLDLCDSEDIQLIWLHGWGLDGNSLMSLASLLHARGENYLLDLPGFGKTPLPKSAWGTQEYADEVARFIKELPRKKTFVIGHSFGGRVALRLADKYPELINGVVLVGGAGLQKKRSPIFHIYTYMVKKYGKTVKRIFPFLKKLSLGSADYKNTEGIKREIFTKVISEDLTSIATTITLPVLLIYGENDTETPPEFGKKYKELIKNSVLYILPDQDHWSILRQQQTAAFINNFIAENLL